MLASAYNHIFLSFIILAGFFLATVSNGNSIIEADHPHSTNHNLPSLEKEIQRHIRNFGETKEPSHLDSALEKLNTLNIKDNQGNIISDTARFRIRNFLTLIHYAKEFSDPSFNYSDHTFWSIEDPETAMSSGSYLYPYVQEGLRARLFSWQIEVINLIYEVTPRFSSDERKRFIQSLITSTQHNILEYLQPVFLSDFDHQIQREMNFPRLKNTTFEDRFKHIHQAFDKLGLLIKLSNPGFVQSEYWHWKTIPPTGGAAGMSAEGIKHPESRRQYKVALYENSTTHQTIRLARKLKDLLRDGERNTINFIEETDFYSPDEEEKIKKLARQYPLNDLFIDSLNELFERKKIKKLITEIENKGDELLLDELLSKLESFPTDQFKSEYLRYKSSFFYESWFCTLLAVRKQGKNIPSFSKRQEEVEDRLIASILSRYGHSVSYLVDARGYAGMFSATPKVKDALSEARNKKREEVIQYIEANIKRYRNTGIKEDLTYASRSIGDLKHENFSRKIMPELLEKKARWTFELVALAEQWKEKDHSILNSAVQTMIYAHEQDKTRQTLLLNIIRELAPTYPLLKKLENDWGLKNLEKDLAGYNKKGEGNPDDIASEIDVLTDINTLEIPDAPPHSEKQYRYRSQKEKMLRDRFSYYSQLIKGMERHEPLSPLLIIYKERLFREASGEYGQLPYQAYNIAYIAYELEGTSMHGLFVALTHSINEKIFQALELEFLAYRETGKPNPVYQAQERLYYLNFNERIIPEISINDFTTRKTKAFLKLLENVETFHLESDHLEQEQEHFWTSLCTRFIMWSNQQYRQKTNQKEVDSLISNSRLSDTTKEMIINRLNEQIY